MCTSIHKIWLIPLRSRSCTSFKEKKCPQLFEMIDRQTSLKFVLLLIYYIFLNLSGYRGVDDCGYKLKCVENKDYLIIYF